MLFINKTTMNLEELDPNGHYDVMQELEKLENNLGLRQIHKVSNGQRTAKESDVK